MVLVEPVSLTIGIASLFSTCIECFDYLKTAQSLEDDLDILLVKLDIEKTRLLIWGNAVGVLNVDDEGRAPELNDTTKAELVKRCLERIKSLFSDTDKLQQEYGIQTAPTEEAPTDKRRARNLNFISSNSMSIFKTSYKRFWVRHATTASNHSLMAKTKWAIRNKAKFEGLIIHLKDFIDGLNQILPKVSRESQDRMIGDDVASILDLSKLRLFQSACEEASYPALAEMASVVIEDSTKGTIDRRNVEEWMRDTESIIGDDAHGNPENPAGSAQPLLENISDKVCFRTRMFFVVAGRCMNLETSVPCEPREMGEMAFEQPKIHAITEKAPYSRQWGIGRRIVRFNFKYPQTEDIHKLITRTYKELDDLQREALPVQKLVIYCSPCVCLIQTALEISDEASSPLLDVVIRPDDQLAASCCPNKTGAQRLTAIIEAIKKSDALGEKATAYQKKLTQSLDRLWIEQRLFQIEEETTPQTLPNPAYSARHIFEEHACRRQPYDCGGVVILAEAECCIAMMQASPFPQKARLPREGELYQMKKITDATCGPWERKFLGSYMMKARPSTGVPPSVLGLVSVFSGATNGGFSTVKRLASPPPSPSSKRAKVAPSVTADSEDGEEMIP